MTIIKFQCRNLAVLDCVRITLRIRIVVFSFFPVTIVILRGESCGQLDATDELMVVEHGSRNILSNMFTSALTTLIQVGVSFYFLNFDCEMGREKMRGGADLRGEAFQPTCAITYSVNRTAC